MRDEGLFLVVSGCSGVGKGTVLGEVFKMLPSLNFSVSATTRKARKGEIEGKSYYFLEKEDFCKRVENGEFLEYVNLFDNYYGTLNCEIDKYISNGKDVVLEVDTEGASNIKKQRPNAVMVFILPPSVEIIVSRLKQRQTETEETIRIRTAKIAAELAKVDIYDYVVVNDEVDKCAKSIVDIINAEGLKTFRNISKIKKIRGDK